MCLSPRPLPDDKMKATVPIPCLCLVTDRRMCHGDSQELVHKVASAVRGGVNLVQLREKDLPGGRLLTLAERLQESIRDSAILLINERVDVALATGAEGVQLGEDGLPVEECRRLAGDKLLIGRSVHSLESALAADASGADLLLAGTVFATDSHPTAQPAGPRLLSSIVERSRLPLVGIGGIVRQNVSQAMEAGASGVAVVRAILCSDDPEQAARELKDAMDESWQLRHPTHTRVGRG